MIIMRKRAEEPKRNRTEQMKFWATPEEKDLILKKDGIVWNQQYGRLSSQDGH